MKSYSENNLRSIRKLASRHIGPVRGRPLILLDADHTLAPQDASKIFFKVHGWSEEVMIANFDKHGYNDKSFLIHRRIHWPDDSLFVNRCIRAAENIHLSNAVKSFLVLASKHAHVIVLTGGLSPVWKRVLAREGFNHIPVYGSVDAGRQMSFTSAGKGAFAEALAPHAAWSMAIGDSEIDSQMMHHCNLAVIVARLCKKTMQLNPKLLEETADHPLLFNTSHNDLRHLHLEYIPWENLFSEFLNRLHSFQCL